MATVIVEAVADDEGIRNLEADKIGFEGDDALLVGHAVSKDDGSFHAKVMLTRHLDPRDYEVYAATPGDAKYAPAVSD